MPDLHLDLPGTYPVEETKMGNQHRRYLIIFAFTLSATFLGGNLFHD